MADASDITVYTTDPCAYCTRAKMLLDTRGVSYEEVNLARDPDGRADLVSLTGQMTFPQIVVGGKSIGGFQELLQADRAGRLQEVLSPAA